MNQLPELDIMRYSFTIVNTGEGADYHVEGKFNMDGKSKDMIRAGFTLKSVHGYRLLDPSLIFFMMKPMMHPESINGARSVYEVILMHLGRTSRILYI